MQKIIIIGLDGFPYEYLRLVNGNKLPNLKKVMNSGVYGILKSTIPANTCPALPALYTGKNPAKTGIFDFIKPDGSLVTTKDIKDPTLWDLLDSYGYKQCLAGMRVTYPPPGINGVVISGILDPTEDSDFVHPIERKKEFKDFYPSDSFIDRIIELGKNRKKNRNKIYDYLIEITKRQATIFKKIIEEEKLDFGMLWIGYTDTIQHYFWDDKELILKFFKEVDKIVGCYLNSYPDVNFIIISDHGFGEAPKYDFYLNSWLIQEGYLKVKGGKFGYTIVSIIYSLASILPVNLNKIKFNLFKFSKNKKLKDKVLTFPKVPGVDYNKSLACFGTAWGIKILKKNVENYEKLREEIIEKLKRLKGVEGEKLMKEVWRREDVYYGKYENDVPDIIFVINDKYRCRALLKRKIFSKIRKREWVGNHDSARDGIFIAYGPDIKDTGEFIGEIQIYDIMPTVLHMYGIPIPEDVDGRVLKEIFREDSEFYRREPVYAKIDREMIIISERIKKLKKLGKL